MKRPALSPALALFAVGASVCHCSLPPRRREPLGHMPLVVTTATPEWIPFRIGAGEQVAANPRERHLASLRKITSAAAAATPRFSPDGREIAYVQAQPDGCTRIVVIDLSTGEERRVSPGGSRAWAPAWLSQGRLVYAEIAGGEPRCPRADIARPILGPLGSFDLFTAGSDGSGLRPLLVGPTYDGEPVVGQDGSALLFTSARDGDLELYSARADGFEVRRLTFARGYDGGAALSPDGTKLAWHAARPTAEALDRYQADLARGELGATELEIMVGSAEGQRATAVTKEKKTSFAPAFLPDSRRLIFASDAGSLPGSPNVELYLVDTEAPAAAIGTPALERVTFHEGIDGWPSFSPDGEHVAFTSSRHAGSPAETNVFVARWVD